MLLRGVGFADDDLTRNCHPGNRHSERSDESLCEAHDGEAVASREHGTPICPAGQRLRRGILRVAQDDRELGLSPQPVIQSDGNGDGRPLADALRAGFLRVARPRCEDDRGLGLSPQPVIQSAAMNPRAEHSVAKPSSLHPTHHPRTSSTPDRSIVDSEPR
jgi:hypothetical protein